MAILNKYSKEIEEELKRQVMGFKKSSKPMYQMMAYHLGWIDKKGRPIDDAKVRGKRFRPTLLLLLCEGICGKYKQALPAAVAIELFHNFSLIHDDIEDHDELRRHRPTLWKIQGIEQAINTGDAMFILAELACLGLQKKGIKADKIVSIFNVLNKAFLEIIEGQYLDMSFEKRFDVQENEYLEMTAKKTAALISASVEIGALLASNNKRVIKGAKNFGLNLGLAYQIYDDIAGIWGAREDTGKDKAGDIKKKKKTLPILYVLTKLSNEDKNKFISLYKKGELSQKDIRLIISLLDKTKAREYSLEVGHKYKNKALNWLKKIGLKKYFEKELGSLVENLI